MACNRTQVVWRIGFVWVICSLKLFEKNILVFKNIKHVIKEFIPH